MDGLKSVIVWFVGLIFVLIFFPVTFIVWFLVLPFDKDRMITHWLLIFQGLILCHVMPVWKIKTEGRSKALKGTTYVIISNHQSVLDILLINCLRYRFKWISKVENIKVPVLGWYLRMAGYITVDRENKESKVVMLEESYNCLKKGISIMMFPEGTRSADKEIAFFKRGAFQLAIETGCPILPVLIDGTGGVLPKHGLIFSTGHKISIRVLDPVMPESFKTRVPEELASDMRTYMKQALSDLRSGS